VFRVKVGDNYETGTQERRLDLIWQNVSTFVFLCPRGKGAGAWNLL